MLLNAYYSQNYASIMCQGLNSRQRQGNVMSWHETGLLKGPQGRSSHWLWCQRPHCVQYCQRSCCRW